MSDLELAVERLERTILAALAIPVEERIWTLTEVADHLRYGRGYTEQEIITLPDFPAPLRITGPNGKPRWVASEVIAWAKRRR